jgi:hypothetical protein
MTICKVPECGGKSMANGYCNKHHHQIEMDRRWIADVKKGIKLIKELTQNLKNVETEVGDAFKKLDVLDEVEG